MFDSFKHPEPQLKKTNKITIWPWTSASQKRLLKYKDLMKIRNEIDLQDRLPKSPRISQEDFQKGAGKAHMMKKMKEIKDLERNIVLS